MALEGQLAMPGTCLQGNQVASLSSFEFFFSLVLPPPSLSPLMPLNCSSSTSIAVDNSFLCPREKFFDQIHIEGIAVTAAYTYTSQLFLGTLCKRMGQTVLPQHILIYSVF